MRKIGLLILSLLAVCAQAHEYVTSSVLNSGNIVKLQIPTSGMYSLSYEQIQALGLNPQNVRLLGYGGNILPQNFTLSRTDDVPSIPFYMQLGADGVFSAGDHIISYANGPVGWEWSGTCFAHTRNCYADYGCYFISDNAGEQRLIAIGDTLESESPYQVYTGTQLQVHELEQVNLLDAANGKEGGGREWYGETITLKNNKLTVPFTFSDVDTTQTMILRTEVAAVSKIASTMSYSVAGTQNNVAIAAMDVTDFYTTARSATKVIYNIHPHSSSLPVTLTYSSTDNTAVAYLNYIEMQVPCQLVLRNNHLFIRNTEYIGEDELSLYHLLGADAYTQVWNITEYKNAYIVPTTWKGDTLCWLGDNTKAQCYVAVQTNASKWSSPASRGRISNQNVHKAIYGKQHIIITPNEFRAAAEYLKQVHEQVTPSEQWEVVSDEEVYNEFSSGTPDASAYRWMMKYMYDTAPSVDKQPKSLLLFGDGSFDNRKILSTSAYPYLLTYQAYASLKETEAYATDDYFGWLENNSGINGSQWSDARARMQISVGRLPIRSYDEAMDVVNKLATYLTNETGNKWKQQLCFLADDGNSGIHVGAADAAAEVIQKQAPDFIINKIYLDSYEQESTASGESYPLAYNTFCNLLQTGVLFMDYAGHGSANNICSEMFLTRSQVEKMNNANQGLWMLATCSFAHFDQTTQSTAEVAVLNKQGGAIGVISSDRTVFASENEKLNKLLSANLFYHTDPFTYPYSIGEALRLSKNQNGNNSNKLPFLLLGDPALRLNYPSDYQVSITDIPDTLHALDLVTIRGYISNGDTLSSNRRDTVDFDGQVTITVFDKIQTVATRDNDEPDESKKVIRYFQDYPNKLFTGTADVEDGLFTLQFRMPKDIRYNIGAGRITMYAVSDHDEDRTEAIGHYEQFKIGGSSPWIIDDNQGPDMQIYLNTPLFRRGDNVNATPHFFANLYDKNGINTVGSGIGHDLQLVIDNSPKQTYVLNNYFSAENNSYQKGTISYILPTMSNGSHSLTFRAWDVLNNASTQSLDFVVDSEQGPVVKSLTVYPNPVSQFGTLNMLIENDRPDDILTMDITFYDMVGNKVWSTYRNLTGAPLELDMSESSLPPGSYIYQFIIQNSTQESQTYSGRLIVY